MAPTRSFRDDKNDFHSHHMESPSHATTTRRSRANKQDRHYHHRRSSSVPPPQWHPHEAQATCKISYVIGATAKAIIHGNAPIPYARDAMAKATIHGSATSIKTRWSRRRKAPPPREPSSKRRAMMIKLRSLLPPPSVQVHLWRRPWRRRR
jgi:hypothetical protein